MLVLTEKILKSSDDLCSELADSQLNFPRVYALCLKSNYIATRIEVQSLRVEASLNFQAVAGRTFKFIETHGEYISGRIFFLDGWYGTFEDATTALISLETRDFDEEIDEFNSNLPETATKFEL